MRIACNDLAYFHPIVPFPFFSFSFFVFFFSFFSRLHPFFKAFFSVYHCCNVLTTFYRLCFSYPLLVLFLSFCLFILFMGFSLKWVAISSSRGSSRSRDWTWVSHISGRFFTIWATYEDFNRFNLKNTPAIWYAENMNAIKWTSRSLENKNVKTYTVYTFCNPWWIIAMI